MLRLYRAVEEKHSNEIKHVFKETGGSGITLFLGDLNSASFMAVPQFLKRNGYIDSFASVNKNPDLQYTWKWKIGNQEFHYRIDYIFHPSHITTVESSILPTYSSDHALVVSSLKWEGNIAREEYVSSTLKKKLSYLTITPDEKPAGIFVYMHGAGGGMEQGMSDSLFEGAFKKLKQVLEHKQYIYVCPSTADFEIAGSRNLNEFYMHLSKKHGNLPVILAGASAGARTVLYALQDNDCKFAGVVLLCPAVNEKIYSQKPLSEIPIWIMHGKSDSIIPCSIIEKIVSDLKAKGYTAAFKMVPGGHDEPLAEISHFNSRNEYNIK
jgi:hypothetical protein